MRIATCNLQRVKWGSKRSTHVDAELHTLRADVTVVTEPGPGFIDQHPSSLVSPMHRAVGESWVAIEGPKLAPVNLEIAYERLAVAGRTTLDGTSVLIYGSVLPWNAARSQAPDVFGEGRRDFIEIFETALEEQMADMAALQSAYPENHLIWAGDFNQTLVGHPLNKDASEMLRRAIEKLGLKAMNADAPHLKEGMNAIDLICVEATWSCVSVETYPKSDGRALSDHRWYVVEVQT
ncbi:MAG: hypothetical protein WCF25_06310 [Acidimicrobiales bacterium]